VAKNPKIRLEVLFFRKLPKCERLIGRATLQRQGMIEFSTAQID